MSQRPRIYGHLSVLPGMDEADVEEARRVLADFAERGGYRLVRVFVDDGPRNLIGMWIDMTAALLAEEKPALVVVSLEHFHPHPVLAQHIRDEVAERTGATVLVAVPEPAANCHRSPGDHPTAGPASGHKTWTVTTTSGRTVTGHLPAWANADPSRTGVPPERLGKVLADVCHWTDIPGQSVRAADDSGPGTDTVILGGSIHHHPYTDNAANPIPSAGLPAASIQIIDNHWINDLDPSALTTLAAKLRAQADHLDHEVRPALITARTNWAAAHRTS